jgi:hypothetical protein
MSDAKIAVIISTNNIAMPKTAGLFSLTLLATPHNLENNLPLVPFTLSITLLASH